jgi:translation initiation factor IF-1
VSDIRTLETLGKVVTVHGNNNYVVELSDGESTREIRCILSGKMRRFRINIIPGDEVTVEIPPPFDVGRITFRGKKTEFDHRAKKKKGTGRGGKKRRT